MKSNNHHAPVKCSNTITINANSDRVWEVMTNINNWAAWQTEISEAILNGALQPNASFVWKTGGVKIKSILHTVVPNKQFGWTGKTFGIFAIHNWELVEKNGQTIVSVEESMEGFLVSLLKRSFNRNLEKGMLHWLNALKSTCEK